MTDNKKTLQDAWDRAHDTPGTSVPVGRIVVCDYCNEDWTDRTESGGLLAGSKGVCPNCAPRALADHEKYGEMEFIKGRCPPEMSFADWVRALRGPNAFVRVTKL